MGKDNDIIDSMFNGLIQLVGWIFKQIFNLLGWIIKGLFNLIADAISKKGNNKAISESVQNSEKIYSYNDAIHEIENAELENQSEEQLEERYNYLFVNTALNGVMSVDEKCRALELLNKKLKVFFDGNVLSYGRFNISAIEVSLKMLEQMYGEQSMIVSDSVSDFISDVNNANLKDSKIYLADIFTFSGLLYSPNGKFSSDSQILQKYDLPTFVLQ
jgi:hypothetical protein